ncbi:MAG: hypothetical protein QOI76_3069 [Frankiales bacterium]|jgi:hypothetical protein|nr:hypothetical protein [Frankiales bacterium]
MATNEGLQQQLDAVREEVRQLREQLLAGVTSAEEPRGVLTRRNLLRAAPIAAIGGAMAAMSASPVAAAAGDPVVLGHANDAGSATTSISGGDATSGSPAVGVRGGVGVDWLAAGGSTTDGVELGVGDTGPVLRAHSLDRRYAAEFIGFVAGYLNANGHDVVHVSTEGPGTGIVIDVTDFTTVTFDGSPGTLEPATGLSVHAQGGRGLDAYVKDGVAVAGTASGNGHALSAVSSSPTTSTDAVTIDYQGKSRALYAQSHNPTNINGTVTGVNEGHGIGVWGEQRNSTGAGVGVVGVGGALGRGAQFTGGAAQARLVPSTAASHPAMGKAGDLFVDRSARLWFCQKASSSTAAAVWKQLA